MSLVFRCPAVCGRCDLGGKHPVRVVFRCLMVPDALCLNIRRAVPMPQWTVVPMAEMAWAYGGLVFSGVLLVMAFGMKSAAGLFALEAFRDFPDALVRLYANHG